jgi:hypothetical protein
MTGPRFRATSVCCLLVLGGCGGAARNDGVASASSAPSRVEETTTTTVAPTEEPPGSVGGDAPSPVDTTSPVSDFVSSVEPIPEEVRRRMQGVSMRPGCPVGFEGLRYVRVSHTDPDGRTVQGELVVAASVADDVVTVFRRLHELRFPISRMSLVDDFGRADDPADGADDFASIEADNTSAFNCRRRTGSAAEYSQHSYGTAIDVNPLANPYVGRRGTTSHPASEPYLDRSIERPGMLMAGGPVVAAFADIGWSWGGVWSDVKDYQHFSLTGR